MALPFSRSLRSLDGDRLRMSRVAAIAAVALLTAWAAWLFLARITLVVSSANARTVVDRAVYPVASPVAGRVAEVAVVLGQTVLAGDVLIRLDAGAEASERSRAEAQLAALQREQTEIDSQLAAFAAASTKTIERDGAAVAEEAARRDELSLTEQHARAERNRLEPLRGQGILSESKIAETQAAVERAGAALTTFDRTRTRQQREREQLAAERDIAIAALRQRRARLAGECAQTEIELVRLAADIERRTIRAPAAGAISALGPRAAGPWLAAGGEVATIVAEGALTVAAAFPAAAVGRLREAAPGRLQLDGYPTARFGTLPVQIARIGREVQDGTVAVELVLLDAEHSPVPLQHGLIGTVDIDVERVSPWLLLLHHIGLSREARR